VCTGAFVLAAAGLLDGRRCTTHWAYSDALARRHPTLQVEPDSIFVRDGEVWTSAGVTAGIDLALALVEEDRGSEVARTIARHLVVYLQRPGGQGQFSAAMAAQDRGGTALRDLVAWIREHLDADCSVAALARHAGMSERSLARAFRVQLDTTPAELVERCRVEAARQLLETTDLTVAAVAARTGFGTPATLHRAFGRRVRTTPADYRARFRGRAT
jgi:transcriptional regulator GlxA family with amidase domain